MSDAQHADHVLSRAPRRPAAVLWDMDGTLVDTEPYWMAAEIALVEQYGGTWSTEHANALVGNDLLVAAHYIREHGGVPLAPEEIVLRLLDGVIDRMQDHVPWRPGARQLLAELRRAGVPCALVTMSWASLARTFLDAVPHGTFSVVVTGDQVTRGKPHPEPYLHAARLLGVEPSEALAVEDSPTGVASATAAGMPVLAVPHVLPVEEAAGRVVHPTLDGVDLAFLSGIFDSR
ncbi:MAG TPA: HAD family phosphatase [Actinomycetales bacterium]|nr:HAD family phosphatase [Actinomycetales bacterium]